ncbi:uncharacterized protein LOC123302899 [Chrysoperla carnea]|uniref:uncharacterized protein LOC123302899 n=1 Tax=Chrysoperla carnea TaxID=189513 RepID=UPI001D071F31|nr:uncharacterized protein LOC123302899 [Chrysoperla carnea]
MNVYTNVYGYSVTFQSQTTQVLVEDLSSEQTFTNNKCKLCGVQVEGPENDVCYLCSTQKTIQEERQKAKQELQIQATRMKHISDLSHPEAVVGMTVRVKIPDVDRGRGDARSILAIILSKNSDDFFQLGTHSGTMKGLYSRSQFSVCPEKIISEEEVPEEKLKNNVA